MDFVADESCAGPVIRALREAGHDLVAIAEVAKGATDEQVLELAVKQKRVLLTEDRDFGELVYARGRSSAGVILVRIHSRARGSKAATVVEAVARLGLRLRDAFTVAEPGHSGRCNRERRHAQEWHLSLRRLRDSLCGRVSPSEEGHCYRRGTASLPSSRSS
jgi:predicted nuclease of predicted toxin-antitoxin system